MAGETRATVQRIEQQLTTLADLPQRVDRLESWHKRVLAGAAALCTVIGFTVKILVSRMFQ